MRQIILAIFFLCCPGRADAEQLPPCVPINSLQMHVQHKSEQVFVYQNIFKARAGIKALAVPVPREKPKCKMAGRIWHEGKCWLPKRIPK